MVNDLIRNNTAEMRPHLPQKMEFASIWAINYGNHGVHACVLGSAIEYRE